MIINEIFYSLQGEGKLAGTPSAFIRLAGCPLRCKWCDTRYAQDASAGQDLTLEQIAKKVDDFNCHHIVITGAEPITNPNLQELLSALKNPNRHITIETAGVTFIPDLPCDLMSISPKLSNSTPTDPKLAAHHEKSRLNFNALHSLIENYDYQLKFVIDKPEDMNETKQVISELGNIDPLKVMLMPQAATRTDYITKSHMLAEICKQTGYTFSPRLQILLWNNQKEK